MVTAQSLFGTDIKLVDGDIQFDFNQDFKQVMGKDNLAQALKNRINTGSKELPFYISYGSRIPLLVAEPINILTRNRLKGYVYETLIQDVRVKKIQDVKVAMSKDNIKIESMIIPIDSNNPYNLVFDLRV